MTAQEMFEDLGYVFSEDKYEKIYRKKLKVEDIDYYTIKMISFNKHYKTTDVSIGNGVLTLDELQAINKQAEEMRWLDEEEKY